MKKERGNRFWVFRQAQNFDNHYIKGKYYNMDYSLLPDSERESTVKKGMFAGAIRICTGVIMLLACIACIMLLMANL